MASKKDKGKDEAAGDAAAPGPGGSELTAGPQAAGGAYRVLARKYRPQTFEDAFIGQSAMVRTLANAFAAGRIAHAFMLTGVRGVGKTTTARIIAKALNCTGTDGTRTAPTVTPCGACDACVSITEGRNVDVYEMDAASRTGIDDVREIIDGVRYAPAQARYKVYIIDEVHMLSKQAFNGLLKTLEEPPPHVKFVFATTEIRKVPITVLSRCQRFDLKRVPAEELVQHLARICRLENQEADLAALHLVARVAEGSVRDSLSILDQALALAGGARIEADAVRGMLGLADRSHGLEMFGCVMRGAISEALGQFRSQYDSGADPLAVMQDLTQICHEVTRVKVTGGAPSSTMPEEAAKVSEMASKLTVPQLSRTWQLLLKALGEVQSAPDAAAAAEMALIRIAHASELPPTEQLVRSVMGGGAPAGSAPAAPRSGGGAPGAAPALRMTSSGGETATLRQEPLRQDMPRTEPVAMAAPAPADEARPAATLQSFDDLLELVRERREARLLFALENHVHLVAFDRGRLEIRLEAAAPASFPGELSDKVSRWTGERLVVTVSSAEGAPTVVAQRKAEDEARRASAAQDKLLKAAMAVFPGARIVAVRDKDEFMPAAEPSTGDGE